MHLHMSISSLTLKSSTMQGYHLLDSAEPDQIIIIVYRYSKLII